MQVSAAARRRACVERRFAALMLIGVAGPAWSAAPARPDIPARTCDVRSYGAEGSAIWSQLVHADTAAFQRAIDACAQQGGGTVLVPAGNWLIGPIRLADHMRLHLDKGATLVATGETEPYAPGPDGENKGLIEIDHAHDVLIDGEGTIDGQGAVWWERMRALWRSDPAFASDGAARQSYRDTRPRLILVTDSHNVAIRGVSVVNSPSYHIVIAHSAGVSVEATTITAPAHAPNTDGIDPINSRDILIRGNRISVGDDMVSIKSDRPDPLHPDAASEDIAIIGNILGEGRGLCIGSDTRGGVRHVLFQGNRFAGSMYGIRIKTARKRGGRISDIRIVDTVMTDVETPIVVTSYYGYRPMDLRAAKALLPTGGFILGNQSWPGPDDPAQPVVHDRTPQIDPITISALTATGAQRAAVLTGLPEAPFSVTFDHVRITAHEAPLIRHAQLTRNRTTLSLR